MFKAISIVADTKKLVKKMDMGSLSELRGVQKPITDVEDLLAAIIMLSKIIFLPLPPATFVCDSENTTSGSDVAERRQAANGQLGALH